MTKSANDVVITGVGIVTSQGVGAEPHVALLGAAKPPGVRIEANRNIPGILCHWQRLPSFSSSQRSTPLNYNANEE